MAEHRIYSIEFRRQVAQELLAGETLHSPKKRCDPLRNLVRIWVQKFEAGALERSWCGRPALEPAVVEQRGGGNAEFIAAAGRIDADRHLLDSAISSWISPPPLNGAFCGSRIIAPRSSCLPSRVPS